MYVKCWVNWSAAVQEYDSMKNEQYKSPTSFKIYFPSLSENYLILCISVLPACMEIHDLRAVPVGTRREH